MKLLHRGILARVQVIYAHALTLSRLSNGSDGTRFERSPCFLSFKAILNRPECHLITPPLTRDPGRADKVNLPRVLSSHEDATVRCVCQHLRAASVAWSRRLQPTCILSFVYRSCQNGVGLA